MIVHIDSSFAESELRQKLSDECSLIMRHGHFICCDGKTRRLICNAINECGSRSQRDMMHIYKGFDITQECHRYLTTIDIAAYANNLHQLIELPSEIQVENGPYEWDLYKSLPEIYKHDAQYKNMYAMLAKAMKNNKIVPSHGGGFGSYQQLMQQKNSDTYKDVYRLKCCAIFDRDTDNETDIDTRKNNLLLFLCGKDSSQLKISEMYALPQSGQWIWHMWYKRAVENYFPKEKYEELGINMDEVASSPLGHDYFGIGKVAGYKKDMVPQLAKRMSRMDFEKHAKRFIIGDVEMSEMQLLLLKFVKLI